MSLKTKLNANGVYCIVDENSIKLLNTITDITAGPLAESVVFVNVPGDRGSIPGPVIPNGTRYRLA